MTVLNIILGVLVLGFVAWAGLRVRLWLIDRHIEDGTLPGQRRI